MNTLPNIQAGESQPFVFDRCELPISGWTCTASLKQFPDDPAIFSRVVPPLNNEWPGIVTTSETNGLAVGLYFLTGKMVNLSTNEQETKTSRFFVTKAWA